MDAWLGIAALVIGLPSAIASAIVIYEKVKQRKK